MAGPRAGSEAGVGSFRRVPPFQQEGSGVRGRAGGLMAVTWEGVHVPSGFFCFLSGRTKQGAMGRARASACAGEQGKLVPEQGERGTGASQGHRRLEAGEAKWTNQQELWSSPAACGRLASVPSAQGLADSLPGPHREGGVWEGWSEGG